MSEFTGPAIKLTDADIAAAAAKIDVEPAAIQAVISVETGGRGGFYADGRPRILFEPQQFHFHTQGRFDKQAPSLSSPTWHKTLYASTEEGEYDILTQAIQLDRTQALKSTSWGMFQIMGANYVEAGYGGPERFVQAMVLSEVNHLAAFVSFITSRGLHQALREKNWARFARGYNGAGYEANQYDTKLAAAYATATARGVR